MSAGKQNDLVDNEVPSDDVNTGKSGVESDHWDKGWAWFVVIGASLCNVIIFGILSSVGIILNELTVRYDASPMDVSLMIIISVTLKIIWTPVVSHLSTKIPCRYLVMGGGMLISAGLMIAAFGDTLPAAYVGLCLLAGTGNAFVIAPSFIVINQYFKVKRSKAFAISTAGVGIGGLTFAPFLAHWLSVYGYTGALLLNAGLSLNLHVAGALMRPPPKGTVLPGVQNETTLEHDTSSENETESESEKTHLISLTPKASMLKLLKNPTFLLYMFNIICSALPQFIIFLPPYALELGVSIERSSWLISVNGLMDIVGRLGSWFFFDRVVHGRKQAYHSIFGVAAGFSISMIGYIPSALSLLVCIFLIGMLEGIFSAQRTVVLFEFVDTEDISNAIGLIILAECIGGILGPLLQGAIKSVTGSYAMGYIISGSLFAVSSLIMLIIFCIRTGIL